MTPKAKLITVEEILGIDVFGQKGLALRVRTDNDADITIQLPQREAHALADMIAIAISRLSTPPDRPIA